MTLRSACAKCTKSHYNLPGIHFGFHDGGKPFFKPCAAVESGTWLGSGSNIGIGGAAFPLNEKCHIAFTLTPDGNGNSSVSIYVHKADGTLVGSGEWAIGSWTTSRIIGPDTLPEYAQPPARGFMIFFE